jgi:hypothetical protein
MKSIYYEIKVLICPISVAQMVATRNIIGVAEVRIPDSTFSTFKMWVLPLDYLTKKKKFWSKIRRFGYRYWD